MGAPSICTAGAEDGRGRVGRSRDRPPRLGKNVATTGKRCIYVDRAEGGAVDSPSTNILLTIAAGALLSWPSPGRAHPLPVPNLDERIAAACAAAPESVRRGIEKARSLSAEAAGDALRKLDLLSDESQLCVANAEFEITLGEMPIHRFATLNALSDLVRHYSSVAGPGEAAELLRAASGMILESTPDPDERRRAFGRLERAFDGLGLFREAAQVREQAERQEVLGLRAELDAHIKDGMLAGRGYASRLNKYYRLTWKLDGAEAALRAEIAFLKAVMARPIVSDTPRRDLNFHLARLLTAFEASGDEAKVKKIAAVLAQDGSAAAGCGQLKAVLPEYFATATCPGPDSETDLASSAFPTLAAIRGPAPDPAALAVNEEKRSDLAAVSEKSADESTDAAQARKLLLDALGALESLPVRRLADESRLLLKAARRTPEGAARERIVLLEASLARLIAAGSTHSKAFDEIVLALDSAYATGGYALFGGVGVTRLRGYGERASPATRFVAGAISSFWRRPPDDPRLTGWIAEEMGLMPSPADDLRPEMTASPAQDYQRRWGLAGALQAITRAVDALERDRAASVHLVADLRAHAAVAAHQSGDQPRAEREVAKLCGIRKKLTADYPYAVEELTEDWCNELDALVEARNRLKALQKSFDQATAARTLDSAQVKAMREAYWKAGEILRWGDLGLRLLDFKTLTTGDSSSRFIAANDIKIQLNDMFLEVHGSCGPGFSGLLADLAACRWARYSVAARRFAPELIDADVRTSGGGIPHHRRTWRRGELEDLLNAFYAVAGLNPPDLAAMHLTTASYVDFVTSSPLSAEAPRPLAGDSAGALKSHEAIVGFVVLERHVAAYVIRNAGVVVTPLAITPNALRRRLSRLRSSMNPAGVLLKSLEFDAASANYLHSQLIEPLTGLLGGVDTLYFVPDGPLHALPFAALVAAKPDRPGWKPGSDWRPEWLVQRYAIGVVPSLAWFVGERARPSASPAGARSFIGFAAPVAPRPPFLEPGQSLSPLTKAVPELNELASAFGNVADRVKVDFSEPELFSADLSNHDVIAFATHGFPGNAEREPLMLAGRSAPGSDGLLTAGELARLKLSAELVILSACHTGADGSLDEQTGVARLAKSFLDAGARAALVSHWPVISDSASATTVPVARGSTRPVAALRSAMLAQIEAGGDLRHPASWATFFVMGVNDASTP